MRKFTLYDLPQTVWDTCKARADREGWDMPALVEQLMTDYGAGRLAPSTPPRKRVLSPNRPSDGT